MKKIFSAIIILLLLIGNTIVFADNKPSVNIDVKGNVEADQNIQILINVSDVKNLYAGAAKFKYDKNILKVTGFEKGDLISKSGINVFDVGNKIDNDNGIAEFGGFSCLGKVAGFSGSGTFLIINAQILKKDNFHIKSVPLLDNPNDGNNLKIQLVDNNIKDIDYNFTGYDFKINSGGAEVVSQPKNTDDAGNSTYSVGSGAKNNDESTSGTSENNAQVKSGNSGNNVGENNALSSNENLSNDGYKKSNSALNNSTANGNDSKNTPSKSEIGTNLGKNKDSGITNNLKTNDSKNLSSAKKDNIYIIVGSCVLVVLVLGFIVFFKFKHNLGIKFEKKH